MFDTKKLLDMLVSAGQSAGQSGRGGTGSLLEQVGGAVSQVIGQATQGVREGAQRLDSATGASQMAGGAVRDVSGRSPADLVGQARDFMAKNQLATGAAIGGLAAVLLGTGAGRSVVGSAARMGGLALIGGLAYKALQNYQAGRPLIGGQEAIEPPPAGTPLAIGHAADSERALWLVRAMVAAASSDGIIDEAERQAIAGNLRAAGLDDEAAAFLEQEFARPCGIADLAAAADTPEKATEMFAAARLAIDPDTPEEKAFLQTLAARLSLAPELVAHIDAAAASVKAPA